MRFGEPVSRDAHNLFPSRTSLNLLLLPSPWMLAPCEESEGSSATLAVVCLLLVLVLVFGTALAFLLWRYVAQQQQKKSANLISGNSVSFEGLMIAKGVWMKWNKNEKRKCLLHWELTHLRREGSGFVQQQRDEGIVPLDFSLERLCQPKFDLNWAFDFGPFSFQATEHQYQRGEAAWTFGWQHLKSEGDKQTDRGKKEKGWVQWRWTGNRPCRLLWATWPFAQRVQTVWIVGRWHPTWKHTRMCSSSRLRDSRPLRSRDPQMEMILLFLQNVLCKPYSVLCSCFVFY